VNGNLTLLRELRLKIILKLRHSKWIRDIAQDIIGQFRTNPFEKFTCIHLRTEGDIKNFSGTPPNYYTVDQILIKINKSRDWWGLQIPTLYIAGNHPEIKSIIRQFEETNFWKKVVSKDILTINHTFRSNEGMPQTLPALLDHEVCQHAAALIGNNHSSWSELLFDFFSANGCSDCVMMVNDEHEIMADGLVPFCGSQMLLHYGRTDCRFW